MRHLEETLQIECVRWFSMQYRRFEFLLHHSPNGGRRSYAEAARFKAMGTRRGFPDLVLLVPSGGFHALFIEMKIHSSSSRQSADQMDFQSLLEGQGYRYAVCRSFDDFKKTIEQYLRNYGNNKTEPDKEESGQSPCH